MRRSYQLPSLSFKLSPLGSESVSVLYDSVTVTSRVSAPAAQQATDADQQNVDQFVSFGVVAARVEERAEGLLQTLRGRDVLHSDVQAKRRTNRKQNLRRHNPVAPGQ
jgi:hypothetical protein